MVAFNKRTIETAGLTPEEVFVAGGTAGVLVDFHDAAQRVHHGLGDLVEREILRQKEDDKGRTVKAVRLLRFG